jgi:hypothetical protein
VGSKLASDGINHIDVLINNAGTVSSWYVSTVDGFELQFAVNHLAPFRLTYELLPLLECSQEGTIIGVSSGSHYRTRIHWKDVLLRKHYNCLLAYKQSKLANVLFATELNRRLKNSGMRPKAYPGCTGILRAVPLRPVCVPEVRGYARRDIRPCGRQSARPGRMGGCGKPEKRCAYAYWFYPRMVRIRELKYKYRMESRNGPGYIKTN